MKISVAFLLLTLSGFFGTSAAHLKNQSIGELLDKDPTLFRKLFKFIFDYSSASASGSPVDPIIEEMKKLLGNSPVIQLSDDEFVRHVAADMKIWLTAKIKLNPLDKALNDVKQTLDGILVS